MGNTISDIIGSPSEQNMTAYPQPSMVKVSSNIPNVKGSAKNVPLPSNMANEPFVGTISQYQLVKRPDWMPPYYNKSGLYVIFGDTNPEAPFINPTVIYPSCVYNTEGHMICRTCDKCPLR